LGLSSLRGVVQVEKDVDAVGVALCGYVQAAAKQAIAERGHFALVETQETVRSQLNLL